MSMPSTIPLLEVWPDVLLLDFIVGSRCRLLSFLSTSISASWVLVAIRADIMVSLVSFIRGFMISFSPAMVLKIVLIATSEGGRSTPVVSQSLSPSFDLFASDWWVGTESTLAKSFLWTFVAKLLLSSPPVNLLTIDSSFFRLHP